MSPESWHDDLDRYGDRGQNESGIGSGVDSGKAKSPPVPGSGSGGAAGMGQGPGSSGAGKQVGSETQFSSMDSKHGDDYISGKVQRLDGWFLDWTNLCRSHQP